MFSFPIIVIAQTIVSLKKRYSGLQKSTQLGYILIITSAIFYAFVHVIAKPMLGDSIITEDGLDQIQGINPVVLAACIYILNGMFFTPIAKKSSTPIKKIDSKNWFFLIAIGVAEVSALIVYFFGLKDSSAVNASIFSNGEIIFSLLIALVIFKERLQKNELAPFLMIIVGMIALPISYDLYESDIGMSSLLMGDILIIFSGLLYAIDVNICKYVSDKIDAKRVTQITSFASGIFALSIIVAFNIPFDVDLADMPMISLLSFVGTGIATLFFVIALRLLGGIRTILLYSTTAIFGIIFSTLILAEELTSGDIFSIILVMVGIYFLRNKLGKDDH